jgi:hypothetical protein
VSVPEGQNLTDIDTTVAHIRVDALQQVVCVQQMRVWIAQIPARFEIPDWKLSQSGQD